MAKFSQAIDPKKIMTSDECVLVIRPQTLPVSLYSFY